MENLTIDEFYKELEKSNTTIRDLVNDNFEMIEYVISYNGDFLGFNILLATDNMELYLKDRIYKPGAVIEGYLLTNDKKREFKFFIDGDLEQELWNRVKKAFTESGMIASNAPSF